MRCPLERQGGALPCRPDLVKGGTLCTTVGGGELVVGFSPGYSTTIVARVLSHLYLLRPH